MHSHSKSAFSLGIKTESTEPEINLIPFIDVLLVVLIFLMISTTFTRYQELAITLPTANGSENQADNKQIHIAVSRDGRFAINGKVTDRSQLSSALSCTQKSVKQQTECRSKYFLPRCNICSSPRFTTTSSVFAAPQQRPALIRGRTVL